MSVRMNTMKDVSRRRKASWLSWRSKGGEQVEFRAELVKFPLMPLVAVLLSPGPSATSCGVACPFRGAWQRASIMMFWAAGIEVGLFLGRPALLLPAVAASVACRSSPADGPSLMNGSGPIASSSCTCGTYWLRKEGSPTDPFGASDSIIRFTSWILCGLASCAASSFGGGVMLSAT